MSEQARMLCAAVHTAAHEQERDCSGCMLPYLAWDCTAHVYASVIFTITSVSDLPIRAGLSEFGIRASSQSFLK